MGSSQILRADAKGRIALGSLAGGASSFRATVDLEGRIILEPFAEIPEREKWLFTSKDALASVNAGLKQAGEGKTQARGSFARFVKA